MKNTIKVGIIGGAGYTAGELLRILLVHPYAEISFVYSTTQAGQPVYRTHTDLVGETALTFTDTLLPVDVLFLCLGHGVSRDFLSKNNIEAITKVIDLGNDFRLDGEFEGRHFIYGLPEVRREEIAKARDIANPGCFATAIQLALLPLAKQGLLNKEVHINATTGSTGAGRSLSDSTHFSNRNGNISTYKVFDHQHLKEIGMTLAAEAKGQKPILSFIPVRGNFTRGIFATLYTECPLTQEEADKLYEDYYAGHPFTHVVRQEISLKDAVNTNKCLLHVKKYGDKLLVTSVIDNLLKGASGQAVQNMNLMFGLEETCGLRLKSIGF